MYNERINLDEFEVFITKLNVSENFKIFSTYLTVKEEYFFENLIHSEISFWNYLKYKNRSCYLLDIILVALLYEYELKYIKNADNVCIEFSSTIKENKVLFLTQEVRDNYPSIPYPCKYFYIDAMDYFLKHKKLAVIVKDMRYIRKFIFEYLEENNNINIISRLAPSRLMMFLYTAEDEGKPIYIYDKNKLIIITGDANLSSS